MSDRTRVRIVDGTHAGGMVNGEFTMIGKLGHGTNGSFARVVASELGFTDRSTVRVKVQEQNVFTVGGMPLTAYHTPTHIPHHPSVSTEVHTAETDRTSLLRIREAFSVLDDMTAAIATGQVKGLIVFAPTGVGKSYNVLKVLDAHSTIQELRDDNTEANYKFVRGYVRPIHLYRILHECREDDQTVVFDDCDSILNDENSLNLLKGALDTLGKRTISWSSSASLLKEEDLPREFNFRGGIIFITNMDFENAPNKLAEHLKAIVGRCHYLDLTIDTPREKFLWMREVARTSSMLTDRGLRRSDVEEVLSFVEDHIDVMKDLTLRILILLSDLYRIDKTSWQKRARLTCMRRRVS